MNKLLVFYHYYKNNPLKRVKMKITNICLYILLLITLFGLSVFFYLANSGLFWGAALCLVALLFGGICELLDI